MPEDHGTDTKGGIPTNLRLLALVEEVARAGVPLLPATLADALGLPKPTIHRLLTTAEDEGFLQRDIDGRSYGPGRRMRKIAANTLSSQRIRTERLLIMTALAKEVGETCNLAAPSRDGMVYLDRVETHWPLRIQLPIGSQVPFNCTASGKLYLSSLRRDKLERLLNWMRPEPNTPRSLTNRSDLRREIERISVYGYSTDDQEFMEGMCAIAVPIKDTEGRFMTALAIHAPIQRYQLEGLVSLLPRLQEAAAKLAQLNND